MKMLQDLHGRKWREKLPAAQPITRGLTPAQPITAQNTSHANKPTESSQSENAANDEAQSRENLEKEFEKVNDEGRKLVQCQNFEKAAEKYSKCIQLCPHKTTAYTNRALCYLKLKQVGILWSHVLYIDRVG